MSPRPGKDAAEAVTLAVKIQPRASKNEIVRMEGGTLKIRLTAPPVEGAANEALIKFLSDTFSIAKFRIEIVSGHTSREKRIRLSGMSEAEVRSVLNIKEE